VFEDPKKGCCNDPRSTFPGDIVTEIHSMAMEDEVQPNMVKLNAADAVPAPRAGTLAVTAACSQGTEWNQACEYDMSSFAA